MAGESADAGVSPPGSPCSVVEVPVEYPTPNRTEINGLLTLPTIMLRRIFGYLTYEQMSQSRSVSKQFKAHMERELNAGFVQLGNTVSRSAKRLKKLLPKRESERRNHPYHRYAEVFSALETRHTLLSMTYNKYIEQRFCCFIPGRVLDIAFAIVRRFNGYLDANQEVAIDMLTVLVEVRDYSSMAMEHFEEYVAPGFPIKPPYSGSAFRPSRLTFNNIIRVGGGSSASFSENHDEFDLDNKLRTLENRHRSRYDNLSRAIGEQNRVIMEQRQLVDKLIDVIGEIGKSVPSSSPKLASEISELSATRRSIHKRADDVVQRTANITDIADDMPSTSAAAYGNNTRTAKGPTAVRGTLPKGRARGQHVADVEGPSTSAATEEDGRYPLRKRRAEQPVDEPKASKRTRGKR